MSISAYQLRIHRKIANLLWVSKFSAMTTCRADSGTSCKRKPCIKSHWSRQEDELLSVLVRIHGPGKWDRIAAHIPGRTGKSCRIRWINQLNPSVDKTPFSAQENRRLLELHREYGNRWSTIASFFSGRTDNQVKNQYHVLSGSRYVKALTLASSSNTDPHGPLEEGSSGLSQNQSMSTLLVGSQFTEMGASFLGGSSVYGGGETITRVEPHSSIPGSIGPDPSDGNGIYPHPRMISRRSSMVSDANSAEAELCPIPQPQQELGVTYYQFIDFLGVGRSE